MKVRVVRAPLVIGTVVAGAMVVLAVLDLIRSSSRWDDRLIVAAGVFASGLALSFVLRLAAGALRPPGGASRRARFVRVAWLIAIAALLFAAVQIALFIDDISFL
jgi:hypothetical protein